MVLASPSVRGLPPYHEADSGGVQLDTRLSLIPFAGVHLIGETDDIGGLRFRRSEPLHQHRGTEQQHCGEFSEQSQRHWDLYLQGPLVAGVGRQLALCKRLYFDIFTSYNMYNKYTPVACIVREIAVKIQMILTYLEPQTHSRSFSVVQMSVDLVLSNQ